MDNLSNYIISNNKTIFDALKVLNEIRDGSMTLYVVTNENILEGTLTDGDIRRALIGGAQLNDSVKKAYNKNFYFFSNKNKNDIKYIDTLRKKGVCTIPYLDENGFDTWDKIFEENKLIAQKKSNASVSLRNAIVTFVLFIEAEYYSENELSGNN